MTNNQIRHDYESLLMMRERIRGRAFKEIAADYDTSASAVSRRVHKIATHCMRVTMLHTQSDPDHPSTPKFTVEEFTADPRAAMIKTMEEYIDNLERHYPAICANDLEALKAGGR